MAKYTTQIKTIVESNYPIFDFDYPIFDPTYKKVLETKIINHYYFREIGLETVGQFKWFLKARMNEIMPFYNQHYLANKVFETYDPYKNKDVTTTNKRTFESDSTGKSERTGKSDSNSSGENTATSKNVFQDTPTSKLGDYDYATNITDDSSSNDGSSENHETNEDQSTNEGHVLTTDDYTSNIKGHDGMKYPTDILKELRTSFINIDVMIIRELEDLFMNIY